MKSYLVTWRINMDADSPEEAAACALIAMRDEFSDATVFEVQEAGTKHPVQIDLSDDGYDDEEN